MKLSPPRATGTAAQPGPVTSSAGLKIWTTLILWPAALASLGMAGNVSVDWHQISGGGGTVTQSPYAVSGTVGQPATALLAGGTYTVQGGFWAFTASRPAASAPVLAIQSTLAGTVVLSWPAAAAGFVLQGSVSLAPPGWTEVPSLLSEDGLNRTVVLSPASGLHFFRLAKP
ncbi:MAG TPA: hypothetical protein VL527_14525 [Dongiaceae bacterium]|nr:hypothetical protein [Dongiaceae bacterium]